MSRIPIACVLCVAVAAAPPVPSAPDPPPKDLATFFRPPAKFAGDLGAYRSPLTFDDGTPVRTAKDWGRRRAEVLKYWHAAMGAWPPVAERPKVELGKAEKRDGFTQHRVRIEVAPKVMADDVYLLVPDGKGPFPAVLVVFYDAATGASLARPATNADYAYQLARRGFVTLSVGGPPGMPAAKDGPPLQPLSYAAFVAANCYQALAAMPEVDPNRVGVVGLSYGGKWAMFASCLYEKFACGVWSDPGVVFDEKRPNVNYWEPWYLGLEPGTGKRTPGVPSDNNPRTGPYKKMIADGRDLHELHALMAPRPFLVSGGSEDPPERWKALNHAVAVNDLLGYRDRVAMTNRPGHIPTAEANDQVYRFFEYVLKPAAPPGKP
ncbi:MAG TPA: sialidase [Urbifossiella sp.]|nr:sialidase [Urbifossiella sp.]